VTGRVVLRFGVFSTLRYYHYHAEHHPRAQVPWIGLIGTTDHRPRVLLWWNRGSVLVGATPTQPAAGVGAGAYPNGASSS
jgi:hypothetical protein